MESKYFTFYLPLAIGGIVALFLFHSVVPHAKSPNQGQHNPISVSDSRLAALYRASLTDEKLVNSGALIDLKVIEKHKRERLLQIEGLYRDEKIANDDEGEAASEIVITDLVSLRTLQGHFMKIASPAHSYPIVFYTPQKRLMSPSESHD